MGFINIDDRDTYNYCTNAHSDSRYKDWLQQLKSELSTSRINHIKGGLFKIDLPVIICTGSNVESYFTIPFMHELCKMELKHTDSSDADSFDPLNYSLQRKSHTNLLLYLYQIKNIKSSDVYDEFNGFLHERCQYLLSTDTTITNKLYVSFYINIVGLV